MADGLLVELPQDCDCKTHFGPHWLHADRLWRESNLRIKQSNPRGFIVEERARIAKKIYEMEKRGLEELLDA